MKENLNMTNGTTPTTSFLVCRGIQARAEYLECDTPIYKGNPFIEALPPLLDEDQAIKCLARYPDYDETERLLANHVRVHMIQNALHFFAPLPIHLDLEQRVSRMIREGYRMRNPMDPQYWRAVNEKLKSYDHLQPSSQILKNQARTLPHGFTIIGCPGVGKSTSLEAILSLYPQVIFHGRYKDRDLTRAQIVWLKLEAPFDSSTKGLCLNFFQAVDDILDTGYEKNYTTGRRTDELLLQMARVAANHGLGVLVIDEIQRLSYAKSGGAEKMLNFFVQLSNTIGIPVVLVGTFKARGILSGAVHQIRRGTGQGDMVWDRMPEGRWVAHDDSAGPGVWQLFLESLWLYQYIRTPCALTPELAHALYEETQGITDFAAKVFMLAQARAITTSKDGKEELSSQIIRSVSADSLKQAQPMLRALRMGDTRALAQYDDMRHIDINPPFGIAPWPCLNRTAEHFQQNVVTICELKTAQHYPRRPRGIFRCDCGFAYSRLGPDKAESDRQKIDRYVSFGEQWDKTLCELLEQGQGYDSIKLRMGVGTRTLARQMIRLGLKTAEGSTSSWALLSPSATKVRDRRKISAANLKEGRANNRRQFQEARRANPELGRAQLRKQFAAPYSWLYQHDRPWLEKHLPVRRKVRKLKTITNWPEKDAELAVAVRMEAERMRALPGRPVIISRTAITRNLGMAYLSKNPAAKLPLTNSALSEAADTRDQFAVRRVKWATSVFQAQGLSPASWRIALLARLSGDSAKAPVVKAALDNAVDLLKSQMELNYREANAA